MNEVLLSSERNKYVWYDIDISLITPLDENLGRYHELLKQNSKRLGGLALRVG